jgi:hypothetical protein
MKRRHMKRELVKEIENCHSCPFLEKEDGFADHWYRCPHFGESGKNDGSNDEYTKVELQLWGWFQDCPKWKYLSE